MTNAWLTSIRESAPGERGLIRSEPVAERYLTHLFVHGDVVHLVFNMLFLYLSGPLIEDVWGTAVLLGFHFGGWSRASPSQRRSRR
ncbi:MAG: rhomboid family intramembrane serine protease [Candidatus Binatia bacterium]